MVKPKPWYRKYNSMNILIYILSEMFVLINNNNNNNRRAGHF